MILVLEEHVAVADKLDFDAVFNSLEVVGLTAGFATKLSLYGISENVIAGYYHDHIFVQKDKTDVAMDALKEFSQPV